MAKKVKPVQDEQSITPEGELVAPQIEGLVIRPVKPIEDRRGEVTEAFNPS